MCTDTSGTFLVTIKGNCSKRICVLVFNLFFFHLSNIWILVPGRYYGCILRTAKVRSGSLWCTVAGKGCWAPSAGRTVRAVYLIAAGISCVSREVLKAILPSGRSYLPKQTLKWGARGNAFELSEANKTGAACPFSFSHLQNHSKNCNKTQCGYPFLWKYCLRMMKKIL